MPKTSVALDPKVHRLAATVVSEIVITGAKTIFSGGCKLIAKEIVSKLRKEMSFVVPRGTKVRDLEAFVDEFLLSNATGLLTRGQESQVYWRLISNLVRELDFRPQEELG